MYILELNQNDYNIEWLAFNTLKEGRAFVKKLPGYSLKQEDEFFYETIRYQKLPNYLEVEYNHHLIPMTKWMFPSEEDINIYWKEIVNISNKGNGLIEGVTRVDAYSINNSDVNQYIQLRESVYERVRLFLETQGFELMRSFRGSQDGEAILYRKKGVDNEWRFLTHLDPAFIEQENPLEDLHLLMTE